MKRFDIQNTGYLDGDYPLFFGKPLGLFDTANEPYPEIVELDEEQQSLFWTAQDISLIQDAIDMREAEPNIKNLIVENLSFQMAGDSYVNGIISDLFSPILSNNAMSSLVAYWSFTETVHAKSYGRIVAEAFDNINELFERIQKSEKMLSRLTFMMDIFKDHKEMLSLFDVVGHTGYLENPEYFQKTIIRTLTALLAFEGIMFIGSFSNTFAVSEVTQKFNGIDKLVGLIHDDEAISHRNNGLAILNIIKNKEKYPVWDSMIPEIKAILDGVVVQELWWADYLFGVCDPILGLNAELSKEYTLYLSKLIYDKLDIPFDFKVVDVSPFDGWMSKHTKADFKQSANQEVENVNYLTSASVDDTDDIDEFDF